MLHVSCAADARYVAHSAAMIHSVLAHAGDEQVHVHYLHGPAFEAADVDLLTQMVRAQGAAISFWSIPDERVADLPTIDHRTSDAGEAISSPMWYRIFLPELLPDVDRILYLDVDTIVADDLRPLWETDVTGKYVAAVTNVFQSDHIKRVIGLGLDDPREYFNSGVLLFNLAEMRRADCTRALREYARAPRTPLVWPDQDVLNAVLGSRRQALHPRWNCMNSVLRFSQSLYVFGANAVLEARRSPGILHFEGPTINKPWHYDNESEFRELYFEHRRGTPWPNVQLEGRTPRAIARRKAQAYRVRGSGVRGRGGADTTA